VAAGLTSKAAQAAPARELVAAAVKAGLTVASGPAAVASVAPSVAHLAKAALPGRKVWLAATLLVTAGLSAAVGLLAREERRPAPAPARAALPRPGRLPRDLDEVRAAIREQNNRMTSLHVAYHVRAEALVDPALLFRWNVAWWLLDADDEVAFKGNKQYCRRVIARELPPLGDPEVEAEKAPPEVRERWQQLQEQFERAAVWVPQGRAKRRPAHAVGGKLAPEDRVTATNGTTIWDHLASTGRYRTGTLLMNENDTVSSVESDDLPEPSLSRFLPLCEGSRRHAPWARADLYLSNAGFGPRPRAGRNGFPEVNLLPEVYDAGWQLLPGTERVDGAACVVLKRARELPEDRGESVDRVWLDPADGLAVRRREARVNGRLTARWLNSGLREAVPGCWLPGQCEWQITPPSYAPPECQGRPVIAYHMELSRLRANDVDDALFEPAPAPDQP
jgi:hypothetical protein